MPNRGTSSASAAQRRHTGLAAEDDEKRVLRERLEALEAQDLDGFEADLKQYSSVFNQRLQALAAANPPPTPDLAGPRIPCVDTSDPFIETNDTKTPKRSSSRLFPFQEPSTPTRPPLPYIPRAQHILFAVPAPPMAHPAAPTVPTFLPGPGAFLPPQMGPPQYPPGRAAAPPNRPSKLHHELYQRTSSHAMTRGKRSGSYDELPRGRDHGRAPVPPLGGLRPQERPLNFPFDDTISGNLRTGHNSAALPAPPPPPPRWPGFPALVPAPPAFAPGPGVFPIGPVTAPIVLGPYPGRPAVLVWHPLAPSRGGVWVALPRDPERRRFVPRPGGGGEEGLRGRGSPFRRGV